MNMLVLLLGLAYLWRYEIEPNLGPARCKVLHYGVALDRSCGQKAFSVWRFDYMSNLGCYSHEWCSCCCLILPQGSWFWKEWWCWGLDQWLSGLAHVKASYYKVDSILVEIVRCFGVLFLRMLISSFTPFCKRYSNPFIPLVIIQYLYTCSGNWHWMYALQVCGRNVTPVQYV